MASENPIIRNYMTIWSFHGLLEKGLHFRSVAAFNDDHEGRLSEPSTELRRKSNKELEKAFDFDYDLEKQTQKYWADEAQLAFADCWRLADGSADAWTVGEGQKKDIAIETRADQYIDALEDQEVLTEINITKGGVIYRDYDSELVPQVPFMERYFSKHQDYEDEKEFRVAFKDYSNGQPALVVDDFGDAEERIGPKDPPTNLYIKYNLNELINNIHVAPHVPEYWKQGIEGEPSILEDILNTYGITAEVKLTDECVQDEKTLLSVVKDCARSIVSAVAKSNDG